METRNGPEQICKKKKKRRKSATRLYLRRTCDKSDLGTIGSVSTEILDWGFLYLLAGKVLKLGVQKMKWRFKNFKNLFLGLKQYGKKRIAIYCNTAHPYFNMCCNIIILYMTFHISDHL